MPVTLTNIRPFAIRAIGVAGIAAAAAVITPLTVASADDQALPGAPTIRSSDRGVVNAGGSEVRSAQIGAPLPGATENSNGGGLVKDGNASGPKGLPNQVSQAQGFGCNGLDSDQHSGFGIYQRVIADCPS